MNDKLNELLQAAKTEPKVDEPYQEPILAQKSNGENIIVPQTVLPRKKLSAMGKFRALIKRNKAANFGFFFLFTVVVMVVLVVLAHVFHIKLGNNKI